MTADGMLSAAQREELLAYTATAADDAPDDAELLSRAADRIGMTGELAIDQEGVLELQRDNILVVLESVADEDRELVDHPELLHLAILVRPDSPAERKALEKANLLDAPSDPPDVADDWTYAWWGSMCTQLPRLTGLSIQLETLNRVMGEAERVMKQRDLTGYFDRMAWLQHEDDIADDEFDDDELDDDWDEDDEDEDEDEGEEEEEQWT
jgi:hypothetical protein